MKTSFRTGFSHWRRALGWAAALSITAAWATTARAYDASPIRPYEPPPPTFSNKSDWSLGLDLGLGGVITKYSVDSLDNGGVLLTGLRLGYGLSEDFTLQLVLDQRWLPNANYATSPGLGVRYLLFSNTVAIPYLEAALGPTLTKDGITFGYNAGMGVEIGFDEAPGLGFGAYARYAEALNPGTGSSDNGRSWSAGLAATLHFGEALAAVQAARRREAERRPVKRMYIHVPDTDHDGYTNDRDQCVDVPAGPHPDPMRPGCPESDEDKDGVPDNIDVCPVTPMGAKPDKNRLGCPFVDRDGDGIVDGDDACPDTPGQPDPSAKKNGCPKAEPRPVRPAPQEEQPETPEGLRPVKKKRTRTRVFAPQMPPPPP